MRSVLILFVSALALVWADIDANAQLRPQKHRALNVPYYQNINPKGSFLPIEFSGAVEAPTRVELTNIHSSLASADGTMIRVEVVGGMSHYPLPAPDDVQKTAIAVFVNASGQAIAPGSRTTAAPVGPFSYCEETIDYPHDFQITDLTRTLYEVEVPAGAVALLVAPIDCPVHDNHDENGNFKVKITYPVPHYKFIQGSRINYDYNEDGVVEMLSDEEAQLEVEVGPGLDVSTSKVYWNSVEISSASSGDNTGSSQKITFDLGEIPETPQGLVPVRIWLKDALGQTVSDETVNVFVMPFKTTIYQVVKEPDLDVDGGPDGVVDLVAGKNADVVVNIAPNMNVSQSELTFHSTVGDIYGPINLDATTSNASGDVTFRVDPIPSSGNFINHVQMQIKIKSADGSLIASKYVPAHIRKTKPIRVGFVPISGCGDLNKCFSGVTTEQAQTLAMQSRDYVSALFPFADNEVQFDQVGQPVYFATKLFPKTGNILLDKALGDTAALIDVRTLSRAFAYYSKLYGNQITHLIGVINESYLQYRSTDIFGMAYVTPGFQGSTAISRNDAPKTVAHELGHLFGLTHGPDGDDALGGYNNLSLSPEWNLPRGPLLSNLIGSIMAPEEGVAGFTPHYWIKKEDYIKAFKNFLVDNRINNSQTDNPIAMQIDCIRMPDGNYRIVNTYLNDYPITMSDVNGEFTLKVKDAHNNLISLSSHAASYSTESDIKILSANILIPSDAVFVEIADSNDQSGQEIGLIVIPADTLSEEVKYIPDQLIRGNPDIVRSQLVGAINNYKDAIINK